MSSNQKTDNEQLIKWWREARFGMFIHWGLYAVPAGVWKGKDVPGIGEWIMHREKIPLKEYRPLASDLNPVKFNAREWVKLAKDAGMKYLVITAKHHDGFAMYDSKCSDYDIVDCTPWGKDPMTALARECKKAGIRLCFYYSQFQDWEHPNGARNSWDFDENKKNFDAYLRDKVKPQLTELLTQYGPIGLIWFDTPGNMTKKQSMTCRHHVKKLQPKCLVSGRVGNDVGDYGSLGDNEHPAGQVKGDWETPCTLNDTWGFKTKDTNWKSADYLIDLLVNCAGKGVNYLLNVGPTAQGVIPSPSVTRLRRVGDWMKINGEAIYGTTGSPFAYDMPWGCITQKRGKLYLLVKRWPRNGALTLSGLRNRVKSARILGSQNAVGITQRHSRKQDEHTLTLALPRKKPCKPVTAVELSITGKPDVDPLPLQQGDGSILLPAHMAALSGPKATHVDRAGYVAGWKRTSPSLTWSFRISEPGTFRVLVGSAVDRHQKQRFGDHDVKVTVDRKPITGVAGIKDVIDDERVNRRHTAWSDIGSLTLDATGEHTATLRVTCTAKDAESGFTATGIRLIPTR
jgi:alpha-L-fucosidase